TCQFDLAEYPFDSQLCILSLVLQGVTKDYVSLQKEQGSDGVKFQGPTRLLEYEFQNLTLEENLSFNNYSLVKINMHLKNLYVYYIVNTYIPTFLLVSIAALTFFFPIEDFNDRIMVSLTTLMVEAAFFTQVSIGIPTTSYLKLIDIWFVFCIVIVFTMMLVHTYINYQKHKLTKVSPELKPQVNVEEVKAFTQMMP
ncbi:unnamed protein product, partial [Meganyctiphanes norvegica]